MIKIEKGIPVPKNHHLHKYPFSEMAVEDSILVEDYAHAKGAQQSAYIFGKKFRRKFISRKDGDGFEPFSNLCVQCGQRQGQIIRQNLSCRTDVIAISRVRERQCVCAFMTGWDLLDAKRGWKIR